MRNPGKVTETSVPSHRFLSDPQPAGTITSGSFCPWLDKSLAMAYVRGGFALVGVPLDVDVRGSMLKATVVPLPFYKRAQ